MTVVAERRAEHDPGGRSAWVRRELHWLAPSLVAALDAVAFVLIAPNVNDIFAGLARESAVLHGVGLNYWFGWFGGGSTPGNYSVLTPYLSAAIGATALLALTTAAITPLAWSLLRGTAHPLPALWAATGTAALNMWSGRVPFALGSLLTLVTVLLLRRRRHWPAGVAALLVVASSPVSGAFLLLLLAGVFLTRPAWRRSCLLTAAPVLVGLLGVALLFGQPGPESFSLVQLVQLAGTLVLFVLADPPDWLRAAIWLTLLAGPVDFLLPNGLGDNILRFAWYCLPAVVLATSARPARPAALAVAAGLVMSAKQTGGDLFAGSQPTASPGYYTSLIRELATLRRPLLTYRLEVVEDGTHTASYALLDHAMLARGYEYQEDNQLNPALSEAHLDATTYKIWLQDNAVGYVAISSTRRKPSPEYALVATRRPDYLVPVWQDAKWTLFRVRDPNPIVRAPVVVRGFSQSRLVLQVPCACRFTVRVHNPEKLRAATTPPKGSTARPVTAVLRPDGFGWTTMITRRPGRYTLSGTAAPPLGR